MAATALVSARLEPEVKERAQGVLRAAGLSDTEVIRRVYDYIVAVGDVPDFVRTGEYSARVTTSHDHFDDMAEWLLTGPFAREDPSWTVDVTVDAVLKGWGTDV